MNEFIGSSKFDYENNNYMLKFTCLLYTFCPEYHLF